MTTKDTIFDAAVHLIGERGYAATTTKAIAERSGLNEVTVFRHFGSKGGILRAIGERITAESERTQLAADTPDIAATLLNVALTEVDNVANFGACALRLAFDVHYDPEVAEVFSSPIGPGAQLDELTAAMACWQQQGRIRTDVDAQILAEAFTSMTGSFLMTRIFLGLKPEPQAHERMAQLVQVFCDGAQITKGRIA